MITYLVIITTLFIFLFLLFLKNYIFNSKKQDDFNHEHNTRLVKANNELMRIILKNSSMQYDLLNICNKLEVYKDEKPSEAAFLKKVS